MTLGENIETKAHASHVTVMKEVMSPWFTSADADRFGTAMVPPKEKSSPSPQAGHLKPLLSNQAATRSASSTLGGFIRTLSGKKLSESKL